MVLPSARRPPTNNLTPARQQQGTPRPRTRPTHPRLRRRPAPSRQWPAADAQNVDPAASLITVETDVVRAEISTQGGTIQSMWLKDYAARAELPEDKFRLLKPQTPNMFIAQSGLLGGAEGQLPNHKSLFTAEQQSYSLAPDADSLTVQLSWTNDAGIEVIKRYRFERGSYLITAEQEVINNSPEAVAVRDYDQLQRTELYDPQKSSFIHTYTGAVYYGPETKYKKESFDDITKAPLDLNIVDGWVAMIQHYFMAAWIPPRQLEQTFYTKTVGGDRYIIGMYSPAVTVPPGASHAFTSELFAGPKLQDTLAEIAPGLELAVDYGWLTILAEPIYWLLSAIHSLVGNWGWAIIILTILIKLAFYKLSETSYKSMANMRKLAPRMQALKDRYGDDKERMNQAMMEMYKKEKINPARRLPADPCADTGLHRPVLGTTGERRTPSRALHPVAGQPDRAGPLFRAAVDHGRVDVRAAKAQSATARSHPGQGHDGAAVRVHGLFRLLPVGPRAVLDRQQPTVHHPAMAHYPSDRQGGSGQTPQLIGRTQRIDPRPSPASSPMQAGSS